VPPTPILLRPRAPQSMSAEEEILIDDAEPSAKRRKGEDGEPKTPKKEKKEVRHHRTQPKPMHMLFG
jgi:hypothetical protein